MPQRVGALPRAIGVMGNSTQDPIQTINAAFIARD
jgi:hypothetical protein